MKKQIIILLLLFISPLSIFCQIDTISNQISLKRIEVINPVITNDILDESIVLALQGRISDPVICNELGFKFIVGSKIPNLGLSIDYNPLFLSKFTGQIEYRSDFKKNQIINASIESKYLINKFPRYFDLKLTYNRYMIENSQLNDFHRFTLGPIFRIPWTSIGLLIGQDTYENQVGFDFYLKYQLHRPVEGSNNEYKSRIVLQSTVGLWDKEFNYDLNIEYLINYCIRCGLGYKKLYDFNEANFTFKYLLCY